MVKKFKELQPPKGFARIGFRLPIQLYRLGLGGLLGKRFLMLTHIGRKSGLERHTVLEVVRYDKKNNLFIVAAGFGQYSDWYQNIRKNPNVIVQCGRKKWNMNTYFMDSEKSGDEMVDYGRRHPLAMRELAQFMGYKLDGTEADVRAMGEMISMVAFRPD